MQSFDTADDSGILETLSVDIRCSAVETLEASFVESVQDGSWPAEVVAAFCSPW